ncbi:MAG TPA: hypothetical protein VEQ42_04400 [Pyrinomonadaceae bacterium]|nr:hypothetical protein [Pyrinomonadaceae bacterium]
MQLTLDELIGYTDEERAKWERWFAAHGDAPLGLRLPGDHDLLFSAALK